MFLINCIAGVTILVMMLLIIYMLTMLIQIAIECVVTFNNDFICNIFMIIVFLCLTWNIYPMVRPIIDGLFI